MSDSAEAVGQAGGSRSPSISKPGRWADVRQKVCGGGFLVVMVGFTWACTVQLAQHSYQPPVFTAPYFVVYFFTTWTILFLPAYLFVQGIRHRGKLALKETLKECTKVFCGLGEDEPRVVKAIGKSCLFCILWQMTCYMFLRALSMQTALDTTAIFATAPSFGYILTWIILHERFVSMKIVSLLLSLTGIILITYHKNFGTTAMWGAILAAGSATGAAFYKALFQKVFGSPSAGQTSTLMSCLGLCNLSIGWPLLLVLYFTKAEPIVWSSVPWDCIGGATSTALVFSFLVCFGPAVVPIQWVECGYVFAIPVSAGADMIWQRHTFGGMQIAAHVLIVIGFSVNLLPENWQDTVLRVAHIKRRQEQPSQEIYSPRARLKSLAG